jgi:hypothetical protein
MDAASGNSDSWDQPVVEKGEDLAFSPVHPGSQKEPQAVGRYHNSNVSKILPLTTLRTIDLGSQDISNPVVFYVLGRIESFS